MTTETESTAKDKLFTQVGRVMQWVEDAEHSIAILQAGPGPQSFAAEQADALDLAIRKAWRAMEDLYGLTAHLERVATLSGEAGVAWHNQEIILFYQPAQRQVKRCFSGTVSNIAHYYTPHLGDERLGIWVGEIEFKGKTYAVRGYGASNQRPRAWSNNLSYTYLSYT